MDGFGFIEEYARTEMPASLQQLSQPPEQLFIHTHSQDNFSSLMQRPRVAIVGSRKVSAYGQAITHHFAHELATRGVVIVSGLAIGTDAIAHRGTLEAGGQTIAVLPGPVEHVYPRVHVQLARHILEQGGALVSEYPTGMPPLRHHFVARNRIVASLSDALLITEAAENSGTLHTANFALEQGIDVLVVPGNITSPTSKGTNNLLKVGATPVTDIADVLHVLGLREHEAAQASRPTSANPHEQQILDLIRQGVHDAGQLLTATKLSVEKFNHHLTMLEITARIRPLGNNQWGTG